MMPCQQTGSMNKGDGSPFLTNPYASTPACSTPFKVNGPPMSYPGYLGYDIPAPGGLSVQPTPSTPMPHTASASFGGFTIGDGTPGFGIANLLCPPQTWSQVAQMRQQHVPQNLVGQSVNDPVHTPGPTPHVSSQPSLGQQTPGGLDYVDAKQSDGRYEYGMPSSIQNDVRMVQPFYSDGTIVKKGRPLWDAFERSTFGLNDTLRLSDFRECLKGKTDENWWMYSPIRTRFHN